MKTIIPAGYRLTVTTWENDADNYNTEILEGLSEADVKFYVALCRKLSDTDDYENRICNLYEPSPNDMRRVGAFALQLFTQFPEYLRANFEDITIEDLAEPEGDGEDDVNDVACDCLTEAASQIGAVGGEFYTRVVSEWKVEYISAPIELEDVTSRFND